MPANNPNQVPPTDAPVYEPPAGSQIDNFACALCEQLANEKDDATIVAPEVVSGLGSFLKLLFRLEAKRRNEANCLT
jgi:hypothetical protein